MDSSCRALGRVRPTEPAATSTRSRASRRWRSSRRTRRSATSPSGRHAPSRDGPRGLYVNSVYTARIDGWSTPRPPGCSARAPPLRQRELHLPAQWRPTCWRSGTTGAPSTSHQRLRGVRREMFRTSVVGTSPIAAGDRRCLTRRGAIGPRPPRRPSTNRRSRAFRPCAGTAAATEAPRSAGPRSYRPEAEREALVHRRANPWWRRILRMFVLLVILGGLLIAGYFTVVPRSSTT